MLTGGRLEAVLRRPRPDGLELLGLSALVAAAVACAVGAAVRPTSVLFGVAAGAAVLVFLARADFALLFVVATAPLEGAFASGTGGVTITKLAGGLAIASFAAAVARERRVLVLERGQALVLGILGLAMLSTIQAHETSPALTTTTRYASFAAVYVIFSQMGHDRVLQRRIAWTLAVTCSVAAGLGLHEYLSGKQQLATLPYVNQNDFAFVLATDHPFLGVGPGNFQFHYNELTGQPIGTFTLTVAHNALLDVGAELGLAAMCLLAAYLVLAFVRLTTSLERGYGDPGFVRALRISLAIAVVSSMFLSEQYFLPFWLIGGLAAAIWTDGQRRAARTG